MKDTVIIRKKECLSCHLLLPAEDQTVVTPSCAKDDFCPAKYMRVVVGTNMRKAALDLASAESTKDSARLAKLYAKLSSYHPDVQALVSSLVKVELDNIQRGTR